MSEIQPLLLLVAVPILAGFLGGLLVSRIYVRSARTPTKLLWLKLLTAEEICLVNREGRPRTILSLDPGEAPVIRFYDREGALRSTLGLGGEGQPALSLFDEFGRNLASFKLDPSGQPRLSLTHKGGGSAAVLGMAREKAVLAFLGQNRKVVWKAP